MIFHYELQFFMVLEIRGGCRGGCWMGGLRHSLVPEPSMGFLYMWVENPFFMFRLNCYCMRQHEPMNTTTILDICVV